MTAGTAAIALSAPFTGALADAAGRKRLITAAMFAIVVPTVIMTFAGSVPQMTVWRFVQGLLLPPIFTVTVAYIGDEWPPGDVPRIAGIYISGSSVGGFCGRFIPGVLTDWIGWRAGDPGGGADHAGRRRHRRAGVAARAQFRALRRFALRSVQMLQHFRDRRLVATFAIGFGVLFNFIATFTYVSFHLAAPPYLFSPTLLGALFLTYLVVRRWCRGSAAPSRCSDAAPSCSAPSRSGSSARCCCCRRRCR